MRHLLRFLLLVLGAWSGGALAQEAGRVILSIGEVTILRPGAAAAAAPVGTLLNTGDTLRTGADSNAQVRFVDEAVMALRPGTEFKVEDYNWPGAANGLERAFFSLVRGGLRTVTGVIGKTNQQNYRVTTPTAALGIRGTNFNIVHCDAACMNRDGSAARTGTYGGVFDGKIGVRNQTPEVVFGVDEFFHVASQASAPERLIGPPPFLGDRLAGAIRRKGQKGTESTETMAQSGVNADSRPLSPPPPAPPQTFVATQDLSDGGYSALGVQVTHIVMAANSDFGGQPSAEGLAVNAANLVFSGSGASQTLVSVDVPAIASLDQHAGKGMVGSSGTDMVGYGAAVNVHWGRWINGSISDDQAPGGVAVPPTGVHYMYSDQITPAEVIAAKSGAFSFNVHVGGTNPTDNSGNTGTFISGSVNVNFTNRTADLHAHWSVGGSNYNVAGVPGLVNIKPGIGAGVTVDAANVGTCGGPCGGAPGTIQQLNSSGVFLGPTGNHLPMSISTRTGTQSTSQIQLFYCATCP